MPSMSDTIGMGKGSLMDSLLLVDRLELHRIIRVPPSASWATTVEVHFNVVPAETADLRMHQRMSTAHEHSSLTW